METYDFFLTLLIILLTTRVFAEQATRLQAPEGQIVLGAAILDNMLGVVLLAVLYEFSIGGGVSLINTGKV